MAEVRRNLKRDGIEVYFPQKPDIQIIQWLKDHRFRWGKTARVWWKIFDEDEWKEVNEYFGIPLPESSIASNPIQERPSAWITSENVMGDLAKRLFEKFPISRYIDIDENILIGIEIEREHAKDEVETWRIVFDHLWEDPRYYTKAKPANWAEKELKKEAEKESIKSFDEYLKEAKEVYGWKNNEAIHEKYKPQLTLLGTVSLYENLKNEYDNQYLNDKIKAATPNLSKIKDVDAALAEIRGEEPELRKEHIDTVWKELDIPVKIYLVDGEAVRCDHIEFTMGGHGYVYDYIPKNEIWIDENLKDKSDDMEATIKHEMFEVRKMRDEGLTYEEAHELANAMEKEVRNEPDVEPKKKMNPFIAMYKGKKHELYAESKYAAQLKAAEFFKVPERDSYKVDVYLAEESKEDIKKREAKEQPKGDIAEARLQKLMILRKFISVSQHEALENLIEGEEREAGLEIVDTLGGILQTMPHTYQTEKTPTNDKIVYLHYFRGGSDWYIVEKDKLPVQQQAFGYAILSQGYEKDYQNAEWGYVNIVELIRADVELDFYFDPIKFGELKKKWQGNEDDDRDELEQVTDEINEMFEGATTEETKQYDDDTESEEKKIFGYEFMFQPANNDGLQLMSTLQGFGIIIGVLDYPNGITLEYRTEKYELIDNSGEFKLNRIGKEGYPDVIDFKDVDGKLKSVFNLAKEIEQAIIIDLKKKPSNQGSSVNFAVGDIIIPYALKSQKGNKRFKISEVFKNEQGENCYKGTFEQENKVYELIKHKDDILVRIEEGRHPKPEESSLHSGQRDKDLKLPETLGEAIENIKNDPYRLNKVIEELLDRKWNDKDWTTEQLEFIKGYSGYGGLNDESEKAGEKLDVKSLFEFYTPDPVIEKMWGLAYKYGYNEGRLLEPSAGVAAFLKREYVKSSVIKDAYEINKYSAKIIKLLYPEVNVNDGLESKYFEQLFIKNNYTVRNKISPVHDLVIGNPPYGAAEGLYMGMGEKTYTHAKNYIDYFIFRGLDLLKKDGLLIYIIGAEVAAGGTPWLDQGTSKCKELIAEKGKLLDAYRLPEGLFARTNVVSDIVCFRRK
jgi:hypothetical protein